MVLDYMSESVAEFLCKRINQMFDRGVKVVLLYNRDDVLFSEKMNMNNIVKWFEVSQYKLTNPLSTSAIDQYGKILNVVLPVTVRSAMQGAGTTYLFNE